MNVGRVKTHGQIRIARSEGRAHRVAIRDQCRELRAKLSEDARKRRENLSQAIKGERLALRGTCSTRLADARAVTDRAIAEARKTAVDLHRLKAAARTPAQAAAAERARLRGATAIKESDDEVRRNLTPDLAIVWEHVKHKPGMRSSKHATRTERFLQWVHDHPNDAQRILITHAESAHLEEESEAAYRARKAAELEEHRRAQDAKRAGRRVRQRSIANLNPQQDLDASAIPF